MPSRFTESVVEEAALGWLADIGYQFIHGPHMAFDEPACERSDPEFRDTILEGRLRRADGSIAGVRARVIDFDNPDNDDFVAVNQFTVPDGQHTRWPDIVLFVNGLPLAVIELKYAADEDATVWSAFNQLQTYQAQIPSLFSTNAVLLISDGLTARIGALGAGREWFKPWRTVEGEVDAPASMAELQVVLQGVFDKRRFLDLVRHFIVFEDEGGGRVVKKYGYPPDLQEAATHTVLEQAALLSGQWAVA